MTETSSDWKSVPKLLRQKIREGLFTGSTSGLCQGYAQANLAILPLKEAFDFLLFCQRNPKPCPILEVSEPGNPILRETAPGADLPASRVYSEGKLVEEVNDISRLWRDDLVGFLLGCSYTFDAVLHRAGIKLPHLIEQREPGIYTTNIETCPAGSLGGPMVVSARAIPGHRVSEVVLTTSRYAKTHGAPVHVGEPQAIGIEDLSQSEYGGSGLTLAEGEVPVFWACGVTPQSVAMSSKVSFMITHKPGHMFVSDLTIEEVIAD
jgi:uncharacterized protein YcsI (UPF0317 family)